MRQNRPPVLCGLTIAGSDSGGGAGIQADARTMGALGVYALTAITAITAQNTRGIATWRPVSSALIAAQVEAVLSDFEVGAIKTGLLPGSAAIRAVDRVLKRYPMIPLVIDPIVGSTSGTRFLNSTGVRTLLKSLLLRATLITPNWPEAALLVGHEIKNEADVEMAALHIVAMSLGRCAVLVKGGHASGVLCRDILLLPNGRIHSFQSRRIKTANTHGTGCVLSSAITAQLAQGKKLEDAVAAAHRFLHDKLEKGKKEVWGAGKGPAFAGGQT